MAILTLLQLRGKYPGPRPISPRTTQQGCPQEVGYRCTHRKTRRGCGLAVLNPRKTRHLWTSASLFEISKTLLHNKHLINSNYLYDINGQKESILHTSLLTPIISPPGPMHSVPVEVFPDLLALNFIMDLTICI